MTCRLEWSCNGHLLLLFHTSLVQPSLLRIRQPLSSLVEYFMFLYFHEGVKKWSREPAASWTEATIDDSAVVVADNCPRQTAAQCPLFWHLWQTSFRAGQLNREWLYSPQKEHFLISFVSRLFSPDLGGLVLTAAMVPSEGATASVGSDVLLFQKLLVQSHDR